MARPLNMAAFSIDLNLYGLIKLPAMNEWLGSFSWAKKKTNQKN
jgi:hypothetical protein